MLPKEEELKLIVYLPLLFYIMAILMYMITVENNISKALSAAMLAPTTFAVAYPVYRLLARR